MPISTLIHVTATYSNAVLVAVLSHVSDCTKKLDLPLPQPITTNQVARFNVNPTKGEVGGGLWLTNGWWFVFQSGCVGGFRSPDNWFTQQDIEGVERFHGKDNMTTNQAIEMARSGFAKLGYKIEDFKLDKQPIRVEGPYENKVVGHVPFCSITWEDCPDPKTPEELANSSIIRFDIDMQKKQFVGMSLIGRKFWRPNPVIGIVPMSESDYQNMQTNHLFLQSNAPPAPQ